MTKKTKTKLWILPLIAITVFIATEVWTQQPQTCNEYTGTYEEDFSTLTYKNHEWCSVRNWTPAPITLQYLGANFEVLTPSGMGARIYACDSGDFDGDGLPDLIGLDITGDQKDATPNRLMLIRNHYADLDADGEDDDGIIYMIDETEVYEEGPQLDVGPCAISTGDYNGDGLLDFFFYKNYEDEFAHTQFLAVMYINIGTATDPDFVTYDVSPNLDFTSAFMGAGIYCNWVADHMASVDIDGDADTDILVISEDKIFLVRNPGPGDFDLSSFAISELNYDQNTGFTTGSPTRGGSTIDAADFDKDGDLDIIGGTVNDVAHLVYYENDGTGYFTRLEIPIPVPECTGTVAMIAWDFNNDGWTDIFAANDLWNSGNEARMYFWKNLGLRETSPGVFEPEFEFHCLNDCLPILPDPHDVDLSAAVDFDLDGDMDVILADANHSGDYYLIRNNLAGVYALNGEARSTDVTGGLEQRQYAVTQVRLLNISQRVLGGGASGLAVELYVSNNGNDWEPYITFLENDIHTVNNLHWHNFTHYGSGLYWKALLSAEEDVMAEFQGASYETPAIYDMLWEFVYVDRREYSRTSVVITTVMDNGEPRKFVIGGTFYFPGWQGHLRAYDVTDMAPYTSSDSILRTVTRMDLAAEDGREMVAAGVTIEWDAGEMLDNRSPASRTIYTAMPPASGTGLNRLDFTTDNVAILAPELQDVNNDNEGLIDFVRGEGRYWKLGDMNHSNPTIVGPPDGDPSYMGSGYDTFLTTHENRREVVYIGANDGMLHCFDVLTGEELWAYVPNNLLPRLRDMWAVDAATGERYFERAFYVDGTAVAADVYIDKDGDNQKEWITILICGQGPGYGRRIGGGKNYYIGLDVTDPFNPDPLWEFNHGRMGETWSMPAFGRVLRGGVVTWVAFTGSGYDNDISLSIGDCFYSIDLEIGEPFWLFNAPDEDTSPLHGWNIRNIIPGSPSVVDLDQDGLLDSVYIGDLDGRIWKVDVTTDFRRAQNWTADILYEDALNYPIVTRPTVWIDTTIPGGIPHLYFGTGGDDRAPNDTTYSFIALLDNPRRADVEWFMGDPALTNLDPALDMGDLGVGEKVWSNPVIANSIVYFNTLTGSIESVNPCDNLAGVGKLYGRYIQSVAGSAIGGTAFRDASGTLASLDLESKTRAAVTLGDTVRVDGTRKREVYIQEYDSTIQKLEQPVGTSLKIKSWREIYKIIR